MDAGRRLPAPLSHYWQRDYRNRRVLLPDAAVSWAEGKKERFMGWTTSLPFHICVYFKSISTASNSVHVFFLSCIKNSICQIHCLLPVTIADALNCGCKWWSVWLAVPELFPLMLIIIYHTCTVVCTWWLQWPYSAERSSKECVTSTERMGLFVTLCNFWRR